MSHNFAKDALEVDAYVRGESRNQGASADVGQGTNVPFYDRLPLPDLAAASGAPALQAERAALQFGGVAGCCKSPWQRETALALSS